MAQSAARLEMPAVPEDLFVRAVRRRATAPRRPPPPVPASRRSCRGAGWPKTRAVASDQVELAVRENDAFVPPYGSSASLYIRPLIIGTGPQLGLKPADEYEFLVMVIPIGGARRAAADVAVPRRRGRRHSRACLLARARRPAPPAARA